MIDEDRIFRQKKLLKDILDNPLFNDLIRELRTGIAEEILESKTAQQREDLYHESQVLSKFIGRLQAVANDVAVMVGRKYA